MGQWISSNSSCGRKLANNFRPIWRPLVGHRANKQARRGHRSADWIGAHHPPPPLQARHDAVRGTAIALNASGKAAFIQMTRNIARSVGWYWPPEAGLFVARPPGDFPPRKVKVLIEILLEHFADKQ